MIGRDPVGDPGLADLALGPDETLGQGRLGDQERPRDLGRREPAQRPQREGDLGIEGKRRMAAGEDQPEPIVLDRHVILLVGLAGPDRGFDQGLPTELIGLGCQHLRPPESVDRPIAGGRRDPGAGIGRHAVARPALEGHDEGFLDRFLGDVEVAEDPDQGRNRPARLLAEQALDDGAGVSLLGQRPRRLARRCVGALAGRSSKIGRTSIEPCRAPGMRAAASIASSRSWASIR